MNTSFFEQDLKELEQKSMRRRLRVMESPQSREISMDGRRVLNFCSNNYLGLAEDSRVTEAAIDALNRYGFGSGASRLICGNHIEHVKLEERIAQIKKSEGALVYSSGYMANAGIISAVFGREDIIFSDKLNHASIVDGILLSRAQFRRYAHNDMSALEQELKNSGGFKKRLIVTDTVFSMDGDRALLKEIVGLARRYEAMVMVDEAHGFGVLGEHGGGLVEEEGLNESIDIQMGTLSKAAGCFGAYVAGSRLLCEYLLNHSRSFIYTTAMPPSCAAAALAAVDIIAADKERRQRVLNYAEALRKGLKALGFDTMNSSTPIIPVLLRDSDKAVDASRRLLEKGIFVQAIRPPTVPLHTARLRVTVTATHTQEDLDHFLAAFKTL